MLSAALNTVVAGCPTLSVCNIIRKRYELIARMEQLFRRSFVRYGCSEMLRSIFWSLTKAEFISQGRDHRDGGQYQNGVDEKGQPIHLQQSVQARFAAV